MDGDESMVTYKVKMLQVSDSEATHQCIVKLSEWDDFKLFHELACFDSSQYAAIFGGSPMSPSRLSKKHDVVKITWVNPHTGRKKRIWREYASMEWLEIDTHAVGLSYTSLNELGIRFSDLVDGCEVRVTKGSTLLHLFFHPDKITCLCVHTCLLLMMGVVLCLVFLFK